MQIHHLTLSAIGPFESEFHVDFGALGASGLFLLEGPTGAGKSTIIDALVYGLYGKVASAEASEDRMRSDHAEDSVESFVDLVFETSHGIFRVVRQPERMRPKKRGTGLTKQQAKAVLYRLSVAELDRITDSYARGGTHAEVEDLGLGEVRSQRLDEVGAEITRVVGLDRMQFAQTIVLPQGEFAKFLRAEPEHRRLLLQKVFGTEIYERAQDQLASMKREALKTIESGEAARRDSIRAFVQSVENPDLDLEALVAGSDSNLEEVLEQEAERLANAENQATDAESEAISAETKALDAYQTAKRTAELFAQRQSLRAEQLQLEAQAESVSVERLRLETAQRASYIEAADHALTRAETERAGTLGAFVTAVNSAQRYCELVPVDGDQGGVSASTVHVFAWAFRDQRSVITEQRDAAQRILGELGEIAQLEQTLQPRGHVLNADATRLAAKKEALEVLREGLAKRPETLAALVEKRDGLAKQAGRIEVLEKQVGDAKAKLAAIQAVTDALATMEQVEAQVKLAAAAAQDAAQHEHDTRMSWLGQLAGTLAKNLEPNTACPVCGSVEHPEPAPIDPEAASKEDVEHAEERRREQEEQLTSIRAKLAAATERYETLSSALGGVGIEEARELHEEASAQLKAAKEAASSVTAMNVDILEFQTATERFLAEEKTLETEIAGLSSKIELQQRQLALDTERVTDAISRYTTDVAAVSPDLIPTEPSIGDVAEILERRVALIGELLAALDSYLAAESAVQSRRDELAQALREQDFDSREDALNAAMSANDRAALNAKIQAYDQRRAALESQLHTAQMQALPDELTVDLEELRVSQINAQNRARQASHVANAVKKTRKEAAFRAQQILSAISGLTAQRAKIQPIVRMADIATGNSTDNEKRITLATYVLMRRFEEVVSAANTRLATLSDGRYELVRSDVKEDVRSRKTGLALKVIDHDTEKSRDPRTLSGGETFNASLSLALGLADVVTAEAGGVELGTLFIDEGFGTLDPDALDKVLSVLSALRDGGRSVGVVSHVETLKQAIPDGISVRRLPSGASTLTVRA